MLLNISSMCSCWRLASSCSRSTSIAKYFISLTFTVRSSHSNSAACKAKNESSVLNNLMKSINVKFGFPTENGRRFESEKEEREDGEGEEDR